MSLILQLLAGHLVARYEITNSFMLDESFLEGVYPDRTYTLGGKIKIKRTCVLGRHHENHYEEDLVFQCEDIEEEQCLLEKELFSKPWTIIDKNDTKKVVVERPRWYGINQKSIIGSLPFILQNKDIIVLAGKIKLRVVSC